LIVIIFKKSVTVPDSLPKTNDVQTGSKFNVTSATVTKV